MALYKTKETALKHLKNGKSFSCKVFDLFREDADVVREAVRHDKWAQIPNCFSDDKDMALYACSHTRYAYQYFSPRIKNDRDVLIATLKSQSNISSERIDFKDLEMLDAYLRNEYCSYENLPSTILSDPTAIIAVVKYKPDVLEIVPYHLLDNESLMNDLSCINIRCFQYASERLRNNFDFVFPYCNQYPLLVKHLGNDLLNDSDFVKHLLSINRNVYNYLPLNMRARKSLAIFVAHLRETHSSIPNEILDEDALVDIMVESTDNIDALYIRLPDSQKMRKSIMDKVFARKEYHFPTNILPLEFLDLIGFAGENWKGCPRDREKLYNIYKTSQFKNSLESKLTTKEETKRTIKI